jgi:AcrR family transcriptional regulator
MAGALELFEARGFERTTVDQIAAAADISRRTFFRYFADKEELFFAEDERLLEVIGETLDGAPAGEPVLELARRATRALAAHSAADPERRLAREALLVPKLALACFQTAYQRWVRDPGQDLPGLVDDSFAALARLTG